MRALTWHGKHDVRIENVAFPRIIQPTDILVKVTLSAICGSDLHIYNGLVPEMQEGDILGHEFMGELVEIGNSVKNIKVGDRVVVPFTIACGNCFFCKKNFFSLCDNSNPDAEKAAKMMGQSPSGLFGYSHLFGGYPGGQAEYVRVPFGDVGPIKIPDGLSDEKVLFLSDVFPTGYMAAENCHIENGDTVAVWGCGPVGQFAIQSAWMLGAGRVIAIDREQDRLNLAATQGKAEVINFEKFQVYEQLMKMTNGRGPDSCIDAVGTEAYSGKTADAKLDKVKQMINLGTDRPHALREAIYCCRKGGHVSVPGVYLGFLDKIPFGSVVNKGLTIKSGQTHVQAYLKLLLTKIEQGEIDPSFLITHRISLDQVPEMYKSFLEKTDGCIKVVIKP